MMHRWAALLVVLALSAFMPRETAAQGPPTSVRERSNGSLKQNFPNPFNPETRIPFDIGDPPTCSEPSRQYRVSLRIYNLLAQLVAVPLLQGGSGGVAGGEPLENKLLTCNSYTAYWDGKVSGTNREAASGVYAYRLEVNGTPITRKMTIRK